MGFLSELKKAAGVIGEINQTAGEISKATVEDYGEPVYSLYTAMQLGEMHRRIDITDGEGNIKYYTRSSPLVITGKTDIMDADGNVIAHLEKKPFSLHEKRFVTMADGPDFTLSNELFHVVKDITRIEGLGWQLCGNFIGLTFNLLDEQGQPVATIMKTMVSMHDKYRIDIYQPEQEQIAVAIVIQLEKMLEERAESGE